MKFCTNCRDLFSGGLNKGRPPRTDTLSIDRSSKPSCRLCALLLDKFQSGTQPVLELEFYLNFPRVYYTQQSEKTIGFKIVNLYKKGPRPLQTEHLKKFMCKSLL
jgi:hypothetical protein